MFRQTIRHSPLWPAAALLALLAAAHTLLAQNAQPTVRADVTNQTAKPIEFALVGPDGKDFGPARSVQPGTLYQTSNRTLPGGSARGYKWVVRAPDTGRVLKAVPADRPQQSITVDNTVNSPNGTGGAFGRQAAQPNLPRKDTSGQDLAAIKAEMIRLTNAERAKANLAPLVEDPRLSRAAQKHTDNMATKQTLDHGLGTTIGQRVKAENFDWQAVDEIITRARERGPANAAEAVQRWMRSTSGHREAILTPRYTHIGVGVQYSSTGVPYYTEVFALSW
jgi:uncharacterized protein YkwD